MKTRIVLGLLMIAGVVGLFVLDWRLELWARAADCPSAQYLAGTPIVLLAALLAVMGTLELARLTAPDGVHVLSGVAGVLVVVAIPVAGGVAARTSVAAGEILAALALVVAAVFAQEMSLRRPAGAHRRVAATLLAVLYIGAGAAVIIALRLDFGLAALVLTLTAVKFADIGAYFTGTLIGKHKLIPWLSPGKTWEGLLGAIVWSGGAAAGVWWALGGAGQFGGMSALQAAALGAVLGLAGQFADLCESLLKRSSGVKDSGALVPAFGGVLDIIDSPLLASPVAYAMLLWLSR
jgi:phosphatidate cytidylyltransferase